MWAKSYMSCRKRISLSHPPFEELPAASNLNDVTAPGHYCCSDNASASSISGRPSGTSGAFELYVRAAIPGRGQSYIHQVMVSYEYAYIYARVRRPSLSWDAWKRIA